MSCIWKPRELSKLLALLISSHCSEANAKLPPLQELNVTCISAESLAHMLHVSQYKTPSMLVYHENTALNLETAQTWAVVVHMHLYICTCTCAHVQDAQTLLTNLFHHLIVFLCMGHNVVPPFMSAM